MSLRVAVLRGGRGEGYQASLESGRIILDYLPTKYIVSDIFVDKDGQWHFGGLPTDAPAVFRDHDLVWSALHSDPEEEVVLRRLFEQHGVNFIGPGSFAAALALNRNAGREFLRRQDLKAPYGLEVSRTDEVGELALEIFRKISGPWLIKRPDNSFGNEVFRAGTVQELQVLLDSAFKNFQSIWVEEEIRGREATVFVIENFRGQRHYNLPIIADGFSNEEKNILVETAIRAFEALGLRHFGEFNLILHPSSRVYVAQVSLMPALRPEGIFHQSLSNIGAKLPHFFDHLVSVASAGRKNFPA